MNSEESKELLIRIDERLKRLDRSFVNHLASHAKYTYLAIATALSAFISLILVLIKG